MKLKLGFVKVRYRGLQKNANRLFTTGALVKLFLVRRKLLYQVAWWASGQSTNRLGASQHLVESPK
jgi:hypothetical protein